MQPGANRTAAIGRRVIQAVFFMILPSSLPEYPGSNEDQQLIVLLCARLVAKQVAEDGDLPETRDHVVLILVVDLENAADDARASVAHEDLSLVLADRQRDVLADGEVQGHGRLPPRAIDGAEARPRTGR